MIVPPPVRFLALVLGAWVLGRTVVLSLPEGAQAPVRRLIASASGAEPAAAAVPAEVLRPIRLAVASGRPVHVATRRLVPATPGTAMPAGAGRASQASIPAFSLPTATVSTPIFDLATLPAPAAPPTSRWSGSAWLFLRGQAGGALAPGGTLGGSQAGGRIAFALDRRTALSARAYLPLEVPEEAELALGVDVRPFASLPLNLLLERRERVGRRGRSAFAATVYGGVSDAAVAGPVQFDAYAQAGMVGLRSRDLFADGSARLHVRAGRAKLGAGAWGAAQPGAERFDVGPTVSLKLPVGTLQADWRFRVTGDARPGSGLAVTLAADF